MAIIICLIFLTSLCESDYIEFCNPGDEITFPTALGGYFTFPMGFYYDNGDYLTDADIPLTFALTPSADLGGTTTTLYTDSNGCVYSSSDFYAVTTGTFQVVMTSPGYTSYTSDYFTVSSNVEQVVVSISSASYGVYQTFTVTVIAKNSAGDILEDGMTITLTETNGSTIQGTSSLANAGITTFSIYFTNTGAKTIQATCNGYSGTASTTTYDNVITINSVSPTVRIT